jgi:hypothetical protein
MSDLVQPADSLRRTLLGAARLGRAAYRAIAAEQRFWGAALLIVMMSAVSHALLGVAWASAGGWPVIRSVVPAALSQIVMWLGLSTTAYVLGRVLGSPGSFGGLLRATGVAWLPTVFYVVGVAVPPFLFVMGAWWVASTYVALRAALALETGPSIMAATAAGIAGFLLTATATVTVLEWLG